ncbi:TetR/AcrR family transcriptional regulator [Psychromonas antarctica]|uniref:TetR/AcrR family transcriptional regulator n=1 Tax=Psychromonas antarctica TaxID=67573 RepID=UPI001EE8FAD5|nr:TetR/AcrR family transcriptional regulator [Psychromonas antarctica]MCG6202715.1 TetR/AcrR family transcriptional regulator [Psychromonas antarctica]
MAKNAKFDRGDVIDKAINLYWEKGFHATSMRNLQEVVDMRPGSVYATFGSKEGLFKEALQRYMQLGIDNINNCRQLAGSPLQGLKKFVYQVVVEKRSSSPSGMCMLAKTISELTEENAELLAQAKQSLKTMEAEFEKVLCDAQTLGELDKNKDTKQLARHIQIQISGMRTYASIHDGNVPLEKMIEDMFTHYPF